MSVNIRRWRLAAAILAAVVWTVGGSRAVTVTGVVAAPRSGPITVVLSGSLSAGSTVDVAIEGLRPPVNDPAIPPATAIVKLNGWIVDVPFPQWDDDEQVWRFSWDIPPGVTGSVVTVAVVEVETGESASSSFVVRP